MSEKHHGYVSLFEALKLFFANFVNFKGRASKSEFLWVFMVGMIVGSCLGAMCMIPYVGWLLLLVLMPVFVAWMIGVIALYIRRLHDTGKSGIFYLMFLIPFAGPIILLIQCIRDSVGDNQWGPGPQ